MAVDLNSASLTELKSLPGVGSAIAEAIVHSRPFTHLEQLSNVKGIGPKRYAAITGTDSRVYIGNAAIDGGKKSVKEESSASGRGAPASDTPRHRPVAPAATAPSRAVAVDINSASARELEQLHGVGPAIAARIVSARPFYRKQDLLTVSGIGDAKYHKMEQHVVVGPVRSTAASSRASSTTDTCDHRSLGREEEQPEGSDTESEDLLELLTEHATRSALHICREVDSDVRASLFSDLNAATAGCEEPASIVQDDAILVASWNIRNISRRKDATLLQRIAEVIGEFDLVALQEVRDVIVLKQLKSYLPGWDFVVSASVGRDASSSSSSEGTGTRSEHFAFMFRRNTVRVTSKYSLTAAADSSLLRAPFVAHFQATEASRGASLNLTLVNVHVTSGDKQERQAEVREIKRLVRVLQDQITPEAATAETKRNVVVLGDFNLAPHEMFTSSRIDGGETVIPLVCAPLTTTVFDRLYDNIWVDLADITLLQRAFQVESGVYRFDWRYYPNARPGFATSMQHTRQLLRRRTAGDKAGENGDCLPRSRAQEARMQCAYEVSDHCPVWVAFAKRR